MSCSEPRPPVAIVIVNHNTQEYLRACLETLDPDESEAIIVVDNASSDGSPAMVRARFPHVRLLSMPTNLGYGAGANLAIAACSAPYVLVLNSDTRLPPGAGAALATYLDRHPTVGLAGPRLLNPDGTLQRSCYPFPRPLNVALRWTGLGGLVGRIPGARQIYPPTSSHARARDVDWVIGAALAIRRAAHEVVDGFDERFFMYAEEVDLCYRLRQAGWRTHFAPVTEITHVGGASTRRYGGAMVVQLFHSLILFYQCHYSPWRLRQLQVILSYLMLRNIIIDRWCMRRAPSEEQKARSRENIATWRDILRETWRAETLGR